MRIIAATNRNLEDEVRAGRLPARISCLWIERGARILPPLRDRAEDIHSDLEHFLDANYNKRSDGAQKVSDILAAIDVLQTYKWPGNVRELVNTVERAVSASPKAT